MNTTAQDLAMMENVIENLGYNNIWCFYPKFEKQAQTDEEDVMQILNCIQGPMAKIKLKELITDLDTCEKVLTLTSCLFMPKMIFELEGNFCGVINVQEYASLKETLLDKINIIVPDTFAKHEKIINTLFVMETAATLKLYTEMRLEPNTFINSDLYMEISKRTTLQFIELFGSEHLDVVMLYFHEKFSLHYKYLNHQFHKRRAMLNCAVASVIG